jgi:hypothetical protein
MAVLENLPQQMARLGTLGFLPPLPSRPFVCSGNGIGILAHIKQLTTWYPHAIGSIEIDIPTEGLCIFDYPEDLEEFHQLLADHSIDERTWLVWQANGDVIQIDLSR